MRWLVCAIYVISSCALAELWVDINVLSKYKPTLVEIETRARRFTFDSLSTSGFDFQASLDEPISITVNGEYTRQYRGKIHLKWLDGVIHITNSTPIEYYVAGVVIGELGAGASIELVKAQSILARTFGLHRRRSTVLSDLAYHQVFKGFDAYAEKVLPITLQTKGIVLQHNDELADVLFHAECGSMIYSAASFWQSDQYIEPRELPEHAGKGAEWKNTLTHQQLMRIYPQLLYFQRIKGVPVEIKLIYASRVKYENAERFRLKINREYGWNTIPSNEYSIIDDNGSWTFKGRGRGHLVGLCQQQAELLAQKGWSSNQLLTLFYPDNTITKMRNQ